MLVRILSMMAMIGAAGMSLASAQTTGPAGLPMAPGPSQPRDFTPGGIGPGGGPIAPGPAARGVNIEQLGPAGLPIAPGPAGSVGAGRALDSPAVAPSSGGIRTTIRTKRKKYRGKGSRRLSREN
jgi:hypothetical protein